MKKDTPANFMDAVLKLHHYRLEHDPKLDSTKYYGSDELPYNEVMEEWIEADRFDTVTSAFSRNFVNEGGEKWMLLLSRKLMEHDRSENLRKLWSVYLRNLESPLKNLRLTYIDRGARILKIKENARMLKESRSAYLRISKIGIKALSQIGEDKLAKSTEKKRTLYRYWPDKPPS